MQGVNTSAQVWNISYAVHVCVTNSYIYMQVHINNKLSVKLIIML